MSVANKVISGVVGSVLLASAGTVGVLANNRQVMFDASVPISNYCSGTVIVDPDLSDGVQDTVITARHCTEKFGEIIPIAVPLYKDGVVVGNGTFNFELVSVSDKADMAIFQRQKGLSAETCTDLMTKAIDCKFEIEPMDIAKSLHFGDEVYILGFPLGGTKVLTSGFVGVFETLLNPLTTSGIWQKFTGAISPGNSGGGVFVSDLLGHWTLAGTVSMVLRSPYETGGYLSYATPLTELQEYLSGQASDIQAEKTRRAEEARLLEIEKKRLEDLKIQEGE